MLVLLNIECSVVIPSKSNRKLEALEAVEVGATVGTVTHGRITVGNKLVVVGAERLPGLICGLFEHDDHKSAHQEGCVALLGVVQRCVVINLVVLVLLIIHELLELLTEQVHLAQVERTKVCEEGLVDKIVVDAEVEGMLPRLWRVLVTDPVQSAWDDFDRLVGVGVALTSCATCFRTWLDHRLLSLS